LLIEANLAKHLYKLVATAVHYGTFTRAPKGTGTDFANRFLDQGNYLAYGLGATAAWVLGIPHAFAVMHGKTRRGALVFDLADLIKDAIVLPTAFTSAMNGDSSSEFRQRCISELREADALDVMIDTLKAVCEQAQ
jgi:CRISPR-associated protein Cas1